LPWKETKPMEERMKFITMYLADEWSISELCRYFGISRKTGYKWIERYDTVGIDGLKDRSRAPFNHPNAVSPEVEQAIVDLRRRKPKRGPKKLHTLLHSRCPEVRWPSVSTIGEIIKRHGLVVSRRRSRKSPPYEQPFAGCESPNSVWSADFKGWFTTQDGWRCDPLTISDNYSRYLIRCQLVTSLDYNAVRPLFEASFREWGLPDAIRTDNGPPFASTTVGGLSRLSIWWIKLGIMPERIVPGKPQQNGRHERMHRTMKDEAISPPKATWKQQQRAFDRFRHEYNYERPHESLDQKTPAKVHKPSARSYPLLIPEMTYPDSMTIRQVKSQGDISWKGKHIYLSETLAGEPVGLKQAREDLWDIYFGPIRLAQLDTGKKQLIHLPRKKRITRKQNKWF